MCPIGPRVRWHKLNLENIDKNEYTIYNITYWGKMERTDFYTKINKQILVSTNFTHYFYLLMLQYIHHHLENQQM